MKAIKIWLIGGLTGSATGLLFFLATLILSIDGELTLIEFGIALITPGIAAFLFAKATNLKLIYLLIVAYLTLVIPVLGPVFGAGDPDVTVAAMIAVLGLVGGLVWSMPFALWAYMKREKAD